jgi:hypothetical protein
MATVGQQLTAPESGWKRYDNSHATMKYSSGFSVHSSSNLYGGTQFQSNVYNANYSFKFIGTKFRIIDALGPNRDKNVQVTVDGIVTGYYSAYQSSGDTFQVLVYELTGLEYGLHTVEVRKITQDSSYISMDCIDIDDTGRLLHPDEVTDIKDLSVGKRIRYNYTAPSGSFGYIGGLGKETSEFITEASSNTPNGDAYFIMVDTDRKGRKILISDRNIQTAIAWDTLNSAGIASGSGIPLKYGRRLNPIMTSQSTPSGFAYASSFYSSYAPWRAFDGVTDNDVGKWSSSTQDGKGWLAYQFPTPTVVSSYRITGHFSSSWIAQNPTDWTFEGSNDGFKWDVLDQQSGVTWSTGAEQKTFDTENRTPYLHYRINITSIGNNSYRAVIGELELFEPLAPDMYVITLRLPTGGLYVSDKDNEWDKYIVNSTLNGTIVAGDNAVWNWNGRWSWTSTTHQEGASYRTLRGYSTVSGHSRTASNATSAAVSGFRPVLVIEELGADFVGGLSPTSIKLDDVSIVGNIVNPLGTSVRYRVLVNGVERLPFSSFGAPPLIVNYVLYNSWFSFGNNQVVLEMETSEGSLTSVIFNVYKDYTKKYLIKDGAEYKAFVDGAWVTVGTSATRDLFLQKGMDALDPSSVMLLSPKIVKVAHWTNEPDSPPLQKNLIIKGEKKVGFRYKVEMLNSPNPPVTLKDWTNSFDTVNETLTISASRITNVNPYEIIVTAVNDDTGLSHSRSGILTLSNITPNIVANMTGMRLDATIGDDDSDRVKFRVELNGVKIYPQIGEYTEFSVAPISYQRVFRSNEVIIGSNNTLRIIAIDEYGAQSEVTINFVGEYAGLMFADEFDNYYSTDMGIVLQLLDMGTLVAGQTSYVFPVKLINKTGFRVTNITLSSDESHMQRNTNLKFSKTESPFIAEETLLYDSVTLDYDDFLIFYVRVETDPQAPPGTGQFDILVKADPAV